MKEFFNIYIVLDKNNVENIDKIISKTKSSLNENSYKITIVGGHFEEYFRSYVSVNYPQHSYIYFSEYDHSISDNLKSLQDCFHSFFKAVQDMYFNHSNGFINVFLKDDVELTDDFYSEVLEAKKSLRREGYFTALIHPKYNKNHPTVEFGNLEKSQPSSSYSNLNFFALIGNKFNAKAVVESVFQSLFNESDEEFVEILSKHFGENNFFLKKDIVKGIELKKKCFKKDEKPIDGFLNLKEINANKKTLLVVNTHKKSKFYKKVFKQQHIKALKQYCSKVLFLVSDENLKEKYKEDGEFLYVKTVEKHEFIHAKMYCAMLYADDNNYDYLMKIDDDIISTDNKHIENVYNNMTHGDYNGQLLTMNKKHLENWLQWKGYDSSKLKDVAFDEDDKVRNINGLFISFSNRFIKSYLEYMSYEESFKCFQDDTFFGSFWNKIGKYQGLIRNDLYEDFKDWNMKYMEVGGKIMVNHEREDNVKFRGTLSSYNKELISYMMREINNVNDKLDGDKIILEAGTMLSAEMFEDLVPWDDDGDMSILFKNGKVDNKVVDKIIAELKGRGLIAKRNGRSIKVYHPHSNLNASKYDWGFPAIDIFFLEQDETHVILDFMQDVKKYDKKNALPVKKIPFLGEEFYTYGNPKDCCVERYNPTFHKQVYKHFIDHRREIMWSKEGNAKMDMNELLKYLGFDHCLNRKKEYIYTD